MLEGCDISLCNDNMLGLDEAALGETLRNGSSEITTSNDDYSFIHKHFDEIQIYRLGAVFLDSKIPGEWSSEDVYHWIEQHRPNLVSKTVLVLSNVSDSGVRAFVDATKILCLVKPFEVADLLAVARRMLRRARAVAHS